MTDYAMIPLLLVGLGLLGAAAFKWFIGNPKD
jgi:hypothetical protein